MTTLFNVYLEVHSPRGVFEGRVTDEPLEKTEALQLMGKYINDIQHAEALNLPTTTEPGSQSVLVFPVEVLKQSVFMYCMKPVLASESATKLNA